MHPPVPEGDCQDPEKREFAKEALWGGEGGGIRVCYDDAESLGMGL